MSIWGTIKKSVTGPVRAIGDLARLKIRRAVGDVADTAKVALPLALAATGVGAPLAIGLGAAEGAADQWGHGENNIGKIALGAGKGAATALAANSAGGMFRGGVRVPTGVPTGVDVGTQVSGDALAQAGGDDFLASVGDAAGGAAGPSAAIAPDVASTVVPNVAPPGGPPAGKFQMPGAFKDIGKFAKKNPAIIAQAAGGALNTFTGVNTDNRRLDIEAQQVANQKDEADRRAKLEELMAMMQGYQSFRPQYRPIGG